MFLVQRVRLVGFAVLREQCDNNPEIQEASFWRADRLGSKGFLRQEGAGSKAQMASRGS